TAIDSRHSCWAFMLSEHGDKAMQRLRRVRLILHHGDADIAFAGICAVGLLAREIAPGDDAHASFLPQAFGHAFAVAEFGNIEPEKKSAGRAHVTVSVADDLVGQIE